MTTAFSVRAKVFRAFLVFVAIIVLGIFVFVRESDAYRTRHRNEHRERLENLLAEHPTEAKIRELLGSPWQESSTDAAVALAKKNWGGAKFSISADLARRSPRTLIYLVGDMVYLLFIDSAGTTIDFALLNN